MAPSRAPLFDSHCHLDAPEYDADRGEVIARARDAGIEGVVVPAVGAEGWDALAALRGSWSAVRIALGVHPYVIGARTPSVIDDALHRLGERARAIGAAAIGECGIDRRTGVALERQCEIVDAHVEVARALELPLVLHVVGAHGLALARMERHGALRAGGVVHGWSGPAELVARWIALGFAIGVGPVVTWARARRLRESARRAPLDALLLESDGPDGRVEREGVRSTRGEPTHVGEVARAVAELRGIAEEELRHATSRNARRLFG